MSDTKPAAPDDDPSDDSVADQIVLMIDGEEVTIDRAMVEELADEIAATPDGNGASGLFDFMAGMPGAELAEAQEIAPPGPGPRGAEEEEPS